MTRPEESRATGAWLVAQGRRPDERVLAPPDALLVVSHALRLDVSTICSTWRTARVVEARSCAAYLLRRGCGMSYPEIAWCVGLRSHSAALVAVRRVTEAGSGSPLLAAWRKVLLHLVAFTRAERVVVHDDLRGELAAFISASDDEALRAGSEAGR
jgi:hypothetical protein